MGVIYELKCNQCGALFAHQEGYGLTETCATCSDNATRDGKIVCPHCRHTTKQGSTEFDRQIEATILWD